MKSNFNVMLSPFSLGPHPYSTLEKSSFFKLPPAKPKKCSLMLLTLSHLYLREERNNPIHFTSYSQIFALLRPTWTSFQELITWGGAAWRAISKHVFAIGVGLPFPTAGICNSVTSTDSCSLISKKSFKSLTVWNLLREGLCFRDETKCDNFSCCTSAGSQFLSRVFRRNSYG